MNKDVTPVIEWLADDKYISPILDEDFEPGQMALTHKAIITIGNKNRHCYVKIYPGDRQRLAHEIAGHCICTISGVQTAKYAGIINIPSTILRKIFPKQSIPSGKHTAFITTDLATNSPENAAIAKIGYAIPDEIGKLQKDFFAWDQFPYLLAMDDWIANIDRNLGNIYRYGENNWAVFDHGEIFGGGGWIPPGKTEKTNTLSWNASYLNKLIKISEFKNELPLPVKNAMLLKSEAFEKIYQKAYKEFVFFWMKLLSNNEFAAATGFLENRAKYAKSFLKHKVQLLI